MSHHKTAQTMKITAIEIIILSKAKTANSNETNNNNTQIYLNSAIIQIKVKTPKLVAEALGKEPSSGNVKCCCKKISLK